MTPEVEAALKWYKSSENAKWAAGPGELHNHINALAEAMACIGAERREAEARVWSEAAKFVRENVAGSDKNGPCLMPRLRGDEQGRVLGNAMEAKAAALRKGQGAQP